MKERKKIMSGLDFGIAGKKAIVCASSKGLGFGCANALAAVGVNLVMCARGADRLAESANQLRKKHGVEITEVACDVTTEEGRAELLDAAGRVDILLIMLAARHQVISEIMANMDSRIGSQYADSFADSGGYRSNDRPEIWTDREYHLRFGKVAYSGAGCQMERGQRDRVLRRIARQVAQHNVTVNGLLPGQYNTDRIETIIANTAKTENISLAAAREMLEKTNPTKRLVKSMNLDLPVRGCAVRILAI